MFIKERNSIIDSLDEGHISKSDFIKMNYDLVMKYSIKPFLVIDDYYKGIYNYQYYNVLAKHYTSEAKKYKDIKKHSRRFQDASNKARNYYAEKDKATSSLIKLMDYKDMNAYFIETRSSRLHGVIYEINIFSHEKTILHSMNNSILIDLKNNGVFSNIVQPSIIESYINSDY